MNSSPAVLLCDYAAGYAVAGVAGGIGLHIIGFGVDDDGGAAVAEERVGAFAEGYVFVLQGYIGLAVRIGSEVAHVAGVVAFRIFEAVLPGFGIEMRTG